MRRHRRTLHTCTRPRQANLVSCLCILTTRTCSMAPTWAFKVKEAGAEAEGKVGAEVEVVTGVLEMSIGGATQSRVAMGR